MTITTDTKNLLNELINRFKFRQVNNQRGGLGTLHVYEYVKTVLATQFVGDLTPVKMGEIVGEMKGFGDNLFFEEMKLDGLELKSVPGIQILQELTLRYLTNLLSWILAEERLGADPLGTKPVPQTKTGAEPQS